MRSSRQPPITPAGLPVQALLPYGREAWSSAFLRTPGMERLYSAVTNSRPCAALRLTPHSGGLDVVLTGRVLAVGAALWAVLHHARRGRTGLGSALQACMTTHARRRGLRGFVADILPGHDRMVRLARNSGPRVQTQRDRESVQITTLF